MTPDPREHACTRRRLIAGSTSAMAQERAKRRATILRKTIQRVPSLLPLPIPLTARKVARKVVEGQETSASNEAVAGCLRPLIGGGRGHHVKPRRRAGRLPGAGLANSWRSTGPAVEQLPAPKVPSSHGSHGASPLILRGVVLLGPFSLGFHRGQRSTECSHPCGDSRFLSNSL